MILVDVPLPTHWDPQPSGRVVHLVSLLDNSDEYHRILQLFISTGGSRQGSQVINIERVQNPTLYRSYALKKQMMGSEHNEMLLFHGTKEKNIQSINVNNFNRSFSGVNGKKPAMSYLYLGRNVRVTISNCCILRTIPDDLPKF